jgi:hypothetical protein
MNRSNDSATRLSGEPLFGQANFLSIALTATCEYYEWQINRIAAGGLLRRGLLFRDISERVLSLQKISYSEEKVPQPGST